MLAVSSASVDRREYVSAPCAKLVCENTDELSLMYHAWLFAEDGKYAHLIFCKGRFELCRDKLRSAASEWCVAGTSRSGR